MKITNSELQTWQNRLGCRGGLSVAAGYGRLPPVLAGCPRVLAGCPRVPAGCLHVLAGVRAVGSRSVGPSWLGHAWPDIDAWHWLGGPATAPAVVGSRGDARRRGPPRGPATAPGQSPAAGVVPGGADLPRI